MGRIAGDNPYYEFRLVRGIDRELDPRGKLAKVTDYGFTLPSVTTILDKVMGAPFSAGAWWGYRISIEGVSKLWKVIDVSEDRSTEHIEELIREHGFDPTAKRDSAGERGSFAHDVLEFLAWKKNDWAEDCAVYEETYSGTKYCRGVIDWWNKEGMDKRDVQPEVPLWSLEYGYAGTADQIIGIPRHSQNNDDLVGYRVLDLKTHKPATHAKPAYLKDLVQVKAYGMAYEEMTGDKVLSYTVLVVDEKGRAFEDWRSVSEEMWLQALELWEEIEAFEHPDLPGG